MQNYQIRQALQDDNKQLFVSDVDVNLFRSDVNKKAQKEQAESKEIADAPNEEPNSGTFKLDSLEQRSKQSMLKKQNSLKLSQVQLEGSDHSLHASAISDNSASSFFDEQNASKSFNADPAPQQSSRSSLLSESFNGMMMENSEKSPAEENIWDNADVKNNLVMHGSLSQVNVTLPMVATSERRRASRSRRSSLR